MPRLRPNGKKIKAIIATVWLIATMAFAIFSPGLQDHTPVFLGLPWVVVLSIICQASIFGLFVFIAKFIWIIEEGDE